MKNLITILIVLVAVGCGGSEGEWFSDVGNNKRLEAEVEDKEGRKLEEDFLKLSVVGSYEHKFDKGTIKVVFFENGKTESYMNVQGNEHPCKFGTWKIKGLTYEMKRVFWIQEKETVVLLIYPNGDLTEIGIIKTINELGERIEKRKDIPKEDQRTYKKLK